MDSVEYAKTNGELRCAICIPTKDRPDTFVQCLDSAVHQTMQCEIVIVDSSEVEINRQKNTAISQCARKIHDEITYVHLPRDMGKCFGHTYMAVAMARQPIVQILFDDDWVEHDRTKKVLSYFLDEDVSIVINEAMIHFEDGRQTTNLKIDKTGFVDSANVQEFIYGIPQEITPCCVTMRREDVLNFLYIRALPFLKDTLISNLVYMLLGALESRKKAVVMRECLTHLTALKDCATLQYMSSPVTNELMLKEYALAKHCFKKMKAVGAFNCKRLEQRLVKFDGEKGGTRR